MSEKDIIFNSMLCTNRGAAYCDEGEVKNGEEMALEAIKFYEFNSHAYRVLGRIYKDNNFFEEADKIDNEKEKESDNKKIIKDLISNLIIIDDLRTKLIENGTIIKLINADESVFGWMRKYL